jgi:hypothetical protein
MTQAFDSARPASATSVLTSELRNNFNSLYTNQGGTSRPTSASEGALWYDTYRRHFTLYVAGHTYSGIGVVRVKDVGHYKEDFFGNALDSRWSTSTPVGSSISFPNSIQTAVRLNTTGSVTVVARHNAKQMRMQDHAPYFRVRVASTVSENRIEVGLEGDANEFLGFIGGTHTNYHLRVTDGVTTTEVDTGVAVNGAYHWFELVAGTMTIARVNDGVEMFVTSPAPTQSWLGFKVQMAGLTTAVKTCDLDYLEQEYLRS